MAPRGRRATGAGTEEEPKAFHQLGVAGRKTGVTIPAPGEVDADGFQPLESIFSSPRKAPQSDSNNGDNAGDDEESEEEDEEDEEDEEGDEGDESGSEDMVIEQSPGPGPRTVLKEQRNLQYPLPRSRSPMKTGLQSPARRNPHMERPSSPFVEDGEEQVTRKLNFASKPTGKGRPAARTNGVNGTLPDSDQDANVVQDVGGDDVELDDSIQMVGALQDEPIEDPPADMGDSDDDEEEEEEEEEEEAVVEAPRPAKQRGRPRTSLPKEPAPEGSATKRRGRPPKATKPPAVEAETQSKTPSVPLKRPQKRPATRISTGGEDDEPPEEPMEEEPRQAKRQRTTQEPKAVSKAAKPEKISKAPASAKSDAASKPNRAAGRPAKLKAVPEDAGETSFMELQKGPPMPKRRGLVSVKRDPDVIVQTRAGRQSYRPLHWWAGDKVITEVEEREDMFKNASGFVTQSTKEVFRAPEEEAAIKRGPRGRGRTKGKSRTQTPQVEDDEPPEDWELDRGVVEGEVMGWEPEYEKHPPADDDHVNVSEDLLAISADAVQTKDIKDATFRFAKTLTMPFMGAGIVDLPPGAEKRPKNSRKMHMVFFVHTGKVLVTVNETEFRISSGGQWFVPRGNYYSITNDYDRPARIFFSQANEVIVAAEGEE